MTFAEWVSTHCQMFGLFDEREIEMVASWRSPLCEAAGFTIEELFAATNWMASQSAPKFRSDHLRMIQTRISDERLAATARENQKRLANSDDRGTCVKCSESGFRVVPHLDSIISGKWSYPWYTVAIYCTCQMGQIVSAGRSSANGVAAAEADAKRKPRPRSIVAMSSAEYERANPFWEGQIEERDRLINEMYAAQQQAQAADRQRGPIDIGRTLAKIGEMPK